MWTARVEKQLEATTEMHNAAITQINDLLALVHAADLALEDMGNCTRCYNMHIRGLPVLEAERIFAA
ncbi:Hypothetical predicted protein [Pelobates cultripes]|uniref:Uncharacterized protein n=1 Tax=Pelobates cultripes TaxID=61616 RepID=A0AAD1SXA6_PELCU|nr:Hypothetical predicted protein [Pelobates cultripes]